jgi:hypothetical protein
MGMRWRRLPDRLSIAVPSPAISSRPTDRAVSSRARSFGVRGQSGRSHFVGVSPNVEEATEGVPRRGPAHRPLSSGRPARGLRASPHWVSLLTPGCFQTQLSDLDLARAFPQTTIVLNHCGEPLAVGPYAGKREGGLRRMADRIREVASLPTKDFMSRKQPKASRAAVPHIGPSPQGGPSGGWSHSGKTCFPEAAPTPARRRTPSPPP